MKSDGSIEYRVGEPMPGTKWVVRGKLGQGGMGLVLDVVKAEWIQGAMKVLLPPFATVPEFAARFLDEVKVTATLQHANIVQVLDFDRLPDGTPFMVMERLRGRTLRAALRETRHRGKAWTPANTYAVAAQVCDGLYRAHSHTPSIVHRDVKPENLFLHRAEGSLESVVKVMDFGVAAVVGERDRRAVGTPRYMAPEQLSGDGVSPQTDQYALGIVLYEMLTGRFPWDVDLRDPSALAEVHLGVAPAPPSRFCSWVPERVDAAILKALSKDPAARHESVHGLMFELVGLQWAGDQSSTGSTDANSTDPMVGTLADGIGVVREEHDTQQGFSSPPLEGSSLEVPGLTELPEISVEIDAEASGAAHASTASRGAAKSPADKATASSTSEGDSAEAVAAARAPMRKPALAAGLQPVDTPMTGESGKGVSISRGVRRMGAVGVVISAAAAALLIAAAMARSSRAPSLGRSTPIESRVAGEATGMSDPIGQEAGPPSAPSDMPAARQPLEPPASLAGASGPMERAPARTPSDRESSAPAARKPAPARPATRPAVMAKGRIPDDGRDELFVPEPR
jgi:serine/threonine protein kinase